MFPFWFNDNAYDTIIFYFGLFMIPLVGFVIWYTLKNRKSVVCHKCCSTISEHYSKRIFTSSDERHNGDIYCLDCCREMNI